MKKIYIILVIVLLNVCCSQPNDNIEQPIEIKNYFFNKNITYWKMQNNNGDTAYFKALEDTIISLAMRFWDTNDRVNVLATPVQFVYWENGMKKRKYFAIFKNNYELCLATRMHPLLTNYNLDFYIYLFKISNKEPIENYKESDSVEYPFGTQLWKMNYVAEWNINDMIMIDDSTYKIYTTQYTAYNNMLTPQTYFENFSFISDFGFYRYMEYNSIIY